jgi:uncharacterized protein
MEFSQPIWGKTAWGCGMGWTFYGHAAVFSTPNVDGDVLAPSCFNVFLREPNHLSIPMLNAHDPGQPVGRWLRMHQDGFGLFVIGELYDNLGALTPPYPGLSVTLIKPQAAAIPNVWGGKLWQETGLEEISLVIPPKHPGARIFGPW